MNPAMELDNWLDEYGNRNGEIKEDYSRQENGSRFFYLEPADITLYG